MTSKELQSTIKEAKYYGYKEDVKYLKDYFPGTIPSQVKTGSRLFVILNRLAVCDASEDEIDDEEEI